MSKKTSIEVDFVDPAEDVGLRAALSTEDMRSVLGLEKAQFDTLIEQSYLPKPRRGLMAVGTAVRGYARYLRESGGEDQPTNGDDMNVGLNQLAKLCGVTRQTITQSWAPKGLPYVRKPIDNGKNRLVQNDPWVFHVPTVVKFLQDEAARRASATVAGAQGLEDVEVTKARKEQALAEIKEFELGVLRAQLINISEVRGLVEEQYAEVRGKLMGLPANVSAELVGQVEQAEIEHILKRDITDILEALSLKNQDSRGESP